jgi:hypothetical protein
LKRRNPTVKASSTSAPSRRTRTATAEKENEPETKIPVVKKAPVKRAVKKVVEAADVEPVTTRTTRSRK